LKGPAEFITNNILHLPPGTLLTRYAKIFFTFFVSGVMHVVADSGGAVPVAQSGALQFFCTQALGILLEDAIQELSRIFFGDLNSRACRAVGFLWVFAFLGWSTPVWVYPVARTLKREDCMLELGALRPLISSFV
jgi:hypothetical protein